MWITLDDDPRAIVVDAGARFLTTEYRRALIFAMKPSSPSLMMAATAAQPSRAGRRPAAAEVMVMFALQPA